MIRGKNMKNLITKFYFGPYVGRNHESRLINLTALFKGSYKPQTSRNFSQLIFYAGMRVSTLVYVMVQFFINQLITPIISSFGSNLLNKLDVGLRITTLLLYKNHKYVFHLKKAFCITFQNPLIWGVLEKKWANNLILKHFSWNERGLYIEHCDMRLRPNQPFYILVK